MQDHALNAAEIAAVVGGYHADPFAILGPHLAENGAHVRVFIPDATAVRVHQPPGDRDAAPVAPAALAMRHPAGFFAGPVADDLPRDYWLEVDFKTGDTVRVEDPYRFGPVLTDFDDYLIAEGTHRRLYDKMGAHVIEHEGRKGVLFAVWAPNALRVSVVGDFNFWDGRRHPMRFHHDSGVWELFLPGLAAGALYKYEIKTSYHDYTAVKADPVGFHHELRPNTASIVWELDNYTWGDDAWLNEGRARANAYDAPISVYEVHLGSWRRGAGNAFLTYRELADTLVPYVADLGYTHIELMPVAEHPYDGSWGYQVTGYYAPTSRFGTPTDFMAFVDACHQAGLGVIVDWVPGHFPKDAHGLSFFDGTYLYEHADPRRGEQPDWGTLIFNFGRREVRQFLVANAIFWCEKYHVDGLRVDAVASMIYHDFSREPGQWLPNRYGGRENLEAIDFLKEMNHVLHETCPGVVTFAEESTSFPGVTHPIQNGGLGFDFKWNMGWMNDTLRYMGNDPVHRAFHQGSLTFSLMYAFSERFILPFSHDEVVHLKRSMLDKMPGDVWQRFANLRLLFGYMITHPGKKLQFMGGEFGQWREWTEKSSLDWHLLDQDPRHGQMQTFVRALNQLYLAEPALHADDFSWTGFTWLDFRDAARSILAFMRHGRGETVLVVLNFTPVVREGFRLGVPEPGVYVERLNSDAVHFGGSGVVNETALASADAPWQDQPKSIQVTLPPLGVVVIKKRAADVSAVASADPPIDAAM